MILGESMEPSDLKTLEPVVFTEVEVRVMELRLKGKTQDAIGKELGCTFQNVSLHLNKPHIVAEMKRRTEGALEAAQERYRQALPMLVDMEIAIALGDEGAESPRVKALQGAIDRAGMAATKKTEVSGKLETTTPDVAAMQARLAEIDAERAELLAAGDEG